MKVNETKTTIIRTENFEESFFGIENNEDMAHIFNILRSKIYSDKVLAVIREYSTNAQDAHILAGTPDRPIRIGLPSSYGPYFTVRDYGPGLSEEAVRSVYVKYGKSTKRDSNDYNGQLGLGCKAGFAYGDSFLISSFQNGVRKDFECYIDETKIGKINKLQEVETIEENGMLISIPVKSMDVNTFVSTAAKFYEYFTPYPECSILKKPEERKGLLGSGKDWKLYTFTRYNDPFGVYNVQALMGNVRYPIDISILRKSVPAKYWNEQVESIVNNNFSLLMNFKIGDLAISSSRESLEYDQQTLKNIVEKIQSAYDELIKDMEKEIVDIKDIFDAKNLWTKLNSTQLSSIFRNSKSGITFNGKRIITDLFTYDNPKKYDYINKKYLTNEYAFSLNYYEARYGYQNLPSKLRANEVYSTNFSSKSVQSEETLFVLNDADKQIRRIKTIIEEDANVKNIILLTPDSENPTGKSIEDWFDSEMIPREYLKKLSDYEPAKNKPKDSPIESKHLAKVFLYDRTQCSYSNIDCWEISDINIKNTAGYYVPIDRFQIHGQDARPFKEFIEIAEQFLGVKDLQVYGIKHKLVEKLGKDMKNFFEVVKELLETKIKDPSLKSMLSSRIMNRYIANTASNDASKFLIEASKDIPIEDYLDLTDPKLEYIALGKLAIQKIENNDVKLLEHILNSSFFVKEKELLEKEYAEKISLAHLEIEKSFPLLEELSTPKWYNDPDDYAILAKIINYIQIMSKSNLEIIDFIKEKEKNDKRKEGEQVSATDGTEE
jgi:hypothetical protein